jgi:cytochrome c
MRFPTFSAGFMLAMNLALGQATQTPTTGSGGGVKPDASWFPPESAFRKVVLDEDAVVDGKATDTIVDPMELAVAKDGRVFWAERKGIVKMWSPSTKATVVIATIPVFDGLEEGMLGITLDPKFLANGWIYLNHSLTETTHDGQENGKSGKIRVSRYTLKGEALDLAGEKTIIEIPVQREQCCHVGGSLAFDAKGNLYVSVGDNTNPFDSDGYSPNDPRKGHYPWDAQRSAANANSLTGKILRITPKADGGYSIPAGNLFKPGTPGTKPEVYVMGNRNPFRIAVDQKTGYLYWGEVGPDAGGPNPQRGPAGHDEVNQARKAGFFGWPYFVGDNKPYTPADYVARQAFNDVNAARAQAKKDGKPESGWPAKPAPWIAADFKPTFYDAAHPVNDSPNNTGIRDLPPAQPAFIYYPPSPSTKFPAVGSGGRTAMAGPVYYFDPSLKSPHKLPKEFDHTLFIYEWSRNWIIAVKLDKDDNIAKDANGKLMMSRFMPSTEIKRPMDVELGADGCLYVIEYGKEWGNNKDTKILRLEHIGEMQ